ncbi:MAG: cadmium-translocating P-type ATPase [Clostridia bacterium]|nr:cadmium-translocating P-type ATPase [Clostridia bacterium]
MKKAVLFFKSELGRIALGFAVFISALIFEKLEFFKAALVLYIIALLVSGIAVFFDAVRGIIRRDFLDEKFLMSIASIGAMIVGEWSEGVAVMLFFLVGEFFEHKAVSRSRKSIKSLMAICPDTANVLVDGEECETDAEDVEVGSLIVIRAGERVPLDAIVIEGASDIDTSALTGESIPRTVRIGDEIKSGVVLLNGVLTAKTVRAAEDSAAARILALVEEANERKSREETFITKFSRVYTPVVIALAILFAVIPPIFDLTSWGDAIYRALIFVVISCPCALVISVPMAFFGGIGCAAANGILFKGGNTFSPLSRVKIFAFDKTGTLTTGKISVSVKDAYSVSKEELLSLAATAEYASNHPISVAIKKAAKSFEKPKFAEDIAGKGVRAVYQGVELLVGNEALMGFFGVNLESKESGIYVAKDRKLIGIIELKDEIKSEAEEAVKALHSIGAEKLIMLSGDKRENAEKVANALNLDECHAALLPEEKYKSVELLSENGRVTVAYVGDGINDSPSLARADVGIAMGSLGSDSAIASADVVLASDNLLKLSESVKIARKTLRIAKENIAFALGVKFLIMVLGAFGIANMWLAVFADVGVAVIAILNSMRTQSFKK